MHSFYSVSVLFKTRFRAGGESNVNYIPLQSHHIVHVAPLLLKYPCNISVGWVCTEFPLCVFLPFIIHTQESKLGLLQRRQTLYRLSPTESINSISLPLCSVSLREEGLEHCAFGIFLGQVFGLPESSQCPM